jgi:hypothetical protein
MNENQQAMWDKWPLKIMAGQCSEEYGFAGLDLAFVGYNTAVSIKMKDLARMLVELLDKGLCNDPDEVGLLLVLEKGDNIKNIPCTFSSDWPNGQNEEMRIVDAG